MARLQQGSMKASFDWRDHLKPLPYLTCDGLPRERPFLIVARNCCETCCRRNRRLVWRPVLECRFEPGAF